MGILSFYNASSKDLVILLNSRQYLKLGSCHTLIKFRRYNKVDFATLPFAATLAQTKREQVEQVYTSAKFLELNPADACRGFPTKLTPQG